MRRAAFRSRWCTSGSSVGDEVYAIHDLTERRAAEAELQRQNEALQEREEELASRNLQLDTALKHMSQGLCMYDKDERVVVCNERFATHLWADAGRREARA